MQDELDEELRSYFLEHNLNFPEEPFLGDIHRLIQRERFRRVLVQRLAFVLGLVCCAFLSSSLVQASASLSRGLSEVFKGAEFFLNTRAGMLSLAACVLLFSILRRNSRLTDSL